MMVIFFFPNKIVLNRVCVERITAKIFLGVVIVYRIISENYGTIIILSFTFIISNSS